MQRALSYQQDLAQLTALIQQCSSGEKTQSQKKLDIYTNYYTKIDSEWIKAFYTPSVLFVAQGEKKLLIGQDAFSIGAMQMAVFPVALPLEIKITRATTVKPFLGVGLTITPEKIAEFVSKVYPTGLPALKKQEKVYVTKIDPKILNAIFRMMNSSTNQQELDLILPLIKDEILIRLLQSPLGVPLAELGFTNSKTQQITAAINWLKENFNQPVLVSDLAKIAHMSISSFHSHFKKTTGMSPLNYQKIIRLQTSRRIMLSKHLDAQEAGYLVGYLSPSQFSRDYKKYFGNSPKKDALILQTKM